MTLANPKDVFSVEGYLYTKEDEVSEHYHDYCGGVGQLWSGRRSLLHLGQCSTHSPTLPQLTTQQGVFVNGVDQGTFRGIRTPAYNGAPPSGYANSPVKDLDSIDLRCNVLGDRQNGYTIQVEPGDNLTFDWHHDKRTAADDVIASSHHGPGLVYISPDPPTEEGSFVKIWEKGLYELGTAPFAPGKWATTADIAANHGHMNVRIPAGLKPGQ